MSGPNTKFISYAQQKKIYPAIYFRNWCGFGIPFMSTPLAASGLEISLAQWSLNRSLRKGPSDNLDFPSIARNKFGIGAVEYVNQFFGGRQMGFKEAAKSSTYLNELLKRSKDAGVVNHLIMVDDEGPLALPKDTS